MEEAEAYDLILSIRGTLPVRHYFRALRPGGTYVMAGGSLFRFMLTSEDLLLMNGLIEAGKVRPIIDKVYPLSETAAAFRHLGNGHARGRVVVRVG